MKIKGKRVLKNGTTAGYIKQKDGSWKWRFITGPRKKKQLGGYKVGDIIEYTSHDGYHSRGKIIQISPDGNNLKVQRMSYKDKQYFSNDILQKEEIISIDKILQSTWIRKIQAYTNNTNINYHRNCNNINKSQIIYDLPPVEFVVYLDVHGYIDETPQAKTLWGRKGLSNTLDDDVNIIYLASAGNMTTEVHRFIFRYIFDVFYKKDGYVLDNNGCPSEDFEKFKNYVLTPEGKDWLKRKTGKPSDIFINNLARVINTIHLNPPGSVINTQYLTLKPGIKFNTIYVKNRMTKDIEINNLLINNFIRLNRDKNMYIGEFIKKFKEYIQENIQVENIRYTFVSGACRQEYHRREILRPNISRSRSFNTINKLSLGRESTKEKQRKYNKVLKCLVKKFGPRRERISTFIKNIDPTEPNELFNLLEKSCNINYGSELNINELKVFILRNVKKIQQPVRKRKSVV